MEKRVLRLVCGGLAAGFLGCWCVLENGQKEMDVVNSQCISSGGEEVQNINVVTYEPVRDFEGCAQEILERYMSNSFHTIDFDHDEQGYPVEINADVYETAEDLRKGDSIFSVSYRQQDAKSRSQERYKMHIRHD